MVDKKVQDHLAKQDASTVDATKLTALTPEVVSVLYYIVSLFIFVICSVVEDFVWYRGTARMEDISLSFCNRKFCAQDVSNIVL